MLWPFLRQKKAHNLYDACLVKHLCVSPHKKRQERQMSEHSVSPNPKCKALRGDRKAGVASVMGDFSKHSPQGGTTEGITYDPDPVHDPYLCAPMGSCVLQGVSQRTRAWAWSLTALKSWYFPLWPCTLVRSPKHSLITISQGNC